MVKTKDEIMESVKAIVGDRSDDDALAFLEDFSDTIESFGEDWRGKYEENDRAWRERYRARFFDGGAVGPEETPAEVVRRHEMDAVEEGREMSFDELFEKREM